MTLALPNTFFEFHLFYMNEIFTVGYSFSSWKWQETQLKTGLIPKRDFIIWKLQR